MASSEDGRITSHSPADTEALGRRVGELAVAGDVILLSGPLGAGKSVLVRGIARGLDIAEPITSPTFVIVRHYRGRLPFHHVDLYRLDAVQELHDLGYEEIFNPDGAVAIEWGEAATEVYGGDRLEIRIEYVDTETRSIELRPLGHDWELRMRDIRNEVG